MKNILAIALITLSSLASCSSHAGTFSAGFEFESDVPAEETGLKTYPGAIALNKKNSDSESANLQFSFGDYGLKVVAVKLRSSDAPERVAQFYREDLARFGKVLDCSRGEATPAEPAPRKSKVLTCDGDKAGKSSKSGMLYKAGNKNDQRVVKIHARGDGSEISLVHVVVKNLD